MSPEDIREFEDQNGMMVVETFPTFHSPIYVVLDI